MKKIDKMNFFYSIGAVIILIGVIAKFLEWKSQDALLLAGLSVEALVFTFSSIQPKTSTIVYKWENIFPELINDENTNSITNTQEKYNYLMSKYIEFLDKSISTLQELNKSTIDNSIKYQNVIETTIKKFEENNLAIIDLTNTVNLATNSVNKLRQIDEEVQLLNYNISNLNDKFKTSDIPLNELSVKIIELKKMISLYSNLGTGILDQFRSIEKK